MSIEIKVPLLPESVADATVSVWHQKPGDWVDVDAPLVDLETDKVMLEVPAPEAGVLKEICFPEGETVTAEQVLAVFEPQAAAPSEDKAPEVPAVSKEESVVVLEKAAPVREGLDDLSPAVRRIIQEHDIDLAQLKGTGKSGRIVKADVERFLKETSTPAKAAAPAPIPAQGLAALPEGSRPEKRVPMTRLRARIAERLVNAQHNAAMLTTFNEVNLQAVMDARAQYKKVFQEHHGVNLGFMSFFTKAAVEALKRFPSVNASIDGQEIIYHGYYDIGVAVSTERGLVVPIIRDAQNRSMSDIEMSIADMAVRARENKLTIEEMSGGTFTITNGGVFGSLLSTPILNPPQAAILGMHKIEQRAVVEDGQIVARPMMYLALSYDHRLIDGKESVQFLRTIKELLEDPIRLLLDV